MKTWTPLAFESLDREVVWGGRRLATAFGRPLPEGRRVGESWELSVRPGAETRLRTASGPGPTLAEVVARDPEAVLGPEVARRTGGRFPLLVKWIDAREDLSVQVHPDRALALELEGRPESKTEAWIVFAADPGARLWLGLQEPWHEEDLKKLLADGRLEEALAAHEVRAGDAFFLPAGTVHALGAGIGVLEVQEDSDVTYRLHDWGRLGLDGRPRALHVEQALRAAARRSGAGRVRPRAFDAGAGAAGETLAACASFRLDRVRVRSGWTVERMAGFEVVSVLEGRGSLEGGGETRALGPGDTVLCPAALGRYRIEGGLTVARTAAPVDG